MKLFGAWYGCEKGCCMRKTLVAVLLMGGLTASTAAQELGTIAGQVLDQHNAIPLPGIPVELSGAVSEIAYTDLDGNYRFAVPAGSYTLKIVMAGYVEQNVTVDVGEGQLTPVHVSLTYNVFTEEITVRAPPIEAETSTAAAQMLVRMRAPAQQDNIGAVEMSANDDSDVGDAMARVTGISVVGGDSVFVRGLGERYSTTTLNGTTMPTTEPDRRVVPLDLFPAGMIDSVQVSKTYTPDMPSQFAGGLVQITPLKTPAESSFEASLGGGLNTLTTFGSGLSYAGGRPWNGFGGGVRALPADFPTRKVIRGGRFTSSEIGFLQSELSRLGRQFSNVWDPTRVEHPLDQSYSATYGGRFGNLGLVATVRHSQSSQQRDERQTFYQVGAAGIEPFNGPYDFEISEFASTIGAVGNVAYQFSPNHRLTLDNFYTHVGRDQARTFEGFNTDADAEILGRRLYFIEEQIRSHHFGGDHLFPQALNSRLDWQVAYSKADRDEPDLREVLYEFDLARSAFVLADESQSGLRQFNVLDDDSLEMSLNYSLLLQQWGGMAAQVKVGGGYIDRKRDFHSRRLRFVPLRVSSLDLSLPAESLFTAANIDARRFQLREETRPTDTYAGEQAVGAFYGMIDLPLSANLRLVGGARMESYRQVVDTYDPFARDISDRPDVIRAELDETNLFPALNLVYAVSPDQNIRFGVSQTVNRPEFRELAPFEFTDVVGGRATAGNPQLTQALIQNVDLRWEWFPAAEEVVSASIFYKNFDDPIERIVEPTAQLRTSYTNAQSAKNIGVELEARTHITSAVLVGANYAFVDSEVQLNAQAGQVQTSLNRPLAGTSRSLINALVEVRGRGMVGRLLWNFYDDRISDVGSLGLPDIIEQGRHALDLVFSRRWDLASVKLALTNLTDASYVFSQGGETQRVFRLGRGFAFGVSLHP